MAVGDGVQGPIPRTPSVRGRSMQSPSGGRSTCAPGRRRHVRLGQAVRLPGTHGTRGWGVAAAAGARAHAAAATCPMKCMHAHISHAPGAPCSLLCTPTGRAQRAAAHLAMQAAMRCDTRRMVSISCRMLQSGSSAGLSLRASPICAAEGRLSTKNTSDLHRS